MARRTPSGYGPGSVPFAYIPSPSSRFLVDSGPLHIRWYGLLLALGVLLGSAIARRELRRRSIDPDLTYAVALWVVPFGLVGARLYHVATDWSTRFAGHWERIPQVWEGGLGIYGALLGGIVGGAIASRRRSTLRHRAAGAARLHRAGDGARTGARSLRELLQPGALRGSHEAPLGPRDLAAEPPGGV